MQKEDLPENRYWRYLLHIWSSQTSGHCLRWKTSSPTGETVHGKLPDRPPVDYNFLRSGRIIYLYRVMISSLLFWRDLVRKLKYWGFQTNPYDPCVMNKVVNGKYWTVCWHMDDLKISHVDSTVVNNILPRLRDSMWRSLYWPPPGSRYTTIWGCYCIS